MSCSICTSSWPCWLKISTGFCLICYTTRTIFLMTSDSLTLILSARSLISAWNWSTSVTMAWNVLYNYYSVILCLFSSCIAATRSDTATSSSVSAIWPIYLPISIRSASISLNVSYILLRSLCSVSCKRRLICGRFSAFLTPPNTGIAEARFWLLLMISSMKCAVLYSSLLIMLLVCWINWSNSSLGQLKNSSG